MLVGQAGLAPPNLGPRQSDRGVAVERLVPQFLERRQAYRRVQGAGEFDDRIECRAHRGAQLRQGRHLLQLRAIGGGARGGDFRLSANQLKSSHFAHVHQHLNAIAEVLHQSEALAQNYNLALLPQHLEERSAHRRKHPQTRAGLGHFATLPPTFGQLDPRGTQRSEFQRLAEAVGLYETRDVTGYAEGLPAGHRTRFRIRVGPGGDDPGARGVDFRATGLQKRMGLVRQRQSLFEGERSGASGEDNER
jgi:hypothetical protein